MRTRGCIQFQDTKLHQSDPRRCVRLTLAGVSPDGHGGKPACAATARCTIAETVAQDGGSVGLEVVHVGMETVGMEKDGAVG